MEIDHGHRGYVAVTARVAHSRANPWNKNREKGKVPYLAIIQA